MARPLLTNADLRDRIDLYLNASERAAIAAKARDAGLHLSAFIRRSALRQKVEAIEADTTSCHAGDQPNDKKRREMRRAIRDPNYDQMVANIIGPTFKHV